jgi:hypothetical protein
MPKREDAHIGPLGDRPHDLPGLLPTDRAWSSVFGAFSGKEQRVAVTELVFLGPQQQRAGQVHLTNWEKHTLG